MNGGRVLVALSGGADSVALLRVMLGLGYGCIAAHCNFHLRGGESDRDEQFVKNLCRDLGVECLSVDFDVAAYMARHRVSAEMACRELRYRWFEEMRALHGCEAVAVAHHADDDAETLFLNLLRGTGIAGLSGIAYRNGRIIRPLLDVGREEIEAYLKAIGQNYIVDSTNLGTEYARNRIRNVVMPAIRGCFPDADVAIRRTIRNLKGNNAVFQAAVEDSRRLLTSRSGELLKADCARLLSSPSPATLLHELLAPYGFNSSQADALCNSAASNRVGSVCLSGDYVAEVGRSEIFVFKKELLELEKEEWQFRLQELPELPVGLSVEKSVRTPDFLFPRNSGTVCFDEKILEETFVLRHWREGDRFRPFGMKGSKKISDYFTDHKFTLFEKRTAWVLCAGGRIVWLVGHRASAEFAVTAETRNVVILKAEI